MTTRYVVVKTASLTVTEVLNLSSSGDWAAVDGYELHQSDTASVGDGYDPGTDTYYGPQSKPDLLGYLNSGIGSYGVGSVACGAYSVTSASIDFASIIPKIDLENLTDTRTITDASNALRTVTNQNILDAYVLLSDHLQLQKDTKLLIMTGINSGTTITQYLQIDDTLSTTFTDIPVTRTQLDPVRVLVDGKQDQADSLDALRSLTISSAVLGLMAKADASGMRDSMELDTAALHPDSYFALSSDLSGKVDKITGKGLSTEDYTTAEKTKLGGIAAGATVNSPDATLLARANHTGTQSADTVVDGTTNKAYTATEKTKLAGIASGATANSSDATLLNRANHTGTQTAATISDFTEAAQDAIGAAVTSEFVYNDAANTLGLRAQSFNNAPGRSVVTGTGATGFQVSATRNAVVNYSVTIATSSTLTGSTNGYVVLEIASTNSATAGDWVEIGRTPSGQSNTLVVGITLNQTGGGQVGGIVPAGYYAKLRSVNVSGTPTYTYNSGQEILN